MSVAGGKFSATLPRLRGDLNVIRRNRFSLLFQKQKQLRIDFDGPLVHLRYLHTRLLQKTQQLLPIFCHPHPILKTIFQLSQHNTRYNHIVRSSQVARPLSLSSPIAEGICVEDKNYFHNSTSILLKTSMDSSHSLPKSPRESPAYFSRPLFRKLPSTPRPFPKA